MTLLSLTRRLSYNINFISRHVQTQNETSLFQYREIPPSFTHCVECLVTWKEGSRLFPCGVVTSLFVAPGDPHLSACSSTEIDPSSDSEGIHLIFLCQSTQILLRHCAPAASALPCSPQWVEATLFLSSCGKGQLNDKEKLSLLTFFYDAKWYRNYFRGKCKPLPSIILHLIFWQKYIKAVYHGTSNIDLTVKVRMKYS